MQLSKPSFLGVCIITTQLFFACSSARVSSVSVTVSPEAPAPPPLSLYASAEPRYAEMDETGMGQQAARPADERFATGSESLQPTAQPIVRHSPEETQTDQLSAAPLTAREKRKQVRQTVKQLKKQIRMDQKKANADQLTTQGFVGIGLIVLGILFIAASPAGFLGGLLAVIFGIALSAVGVALLLMDLYDIEIYL